MRSENNKKSKDIKVEFLGANNVVTGSCTLVTFPNDLKIIIDCGLLQDSSKKFEELQKLNSREFEFNVADISYVLLTHGHIDHVGRLPLLTRNDKFKGKILSTVPTAEFAAINLPDCAYLNEEQCKYASDKKEKDKKVKSETNMKIEPLYTRPQALECVEHIQGYDFDKEIILQDGITITFLPAGHMLGASMILIKYKVDEYKYKTILFTGDISGKETKHPFVKICPDLGEINYIICESTYGDRIHVKNNPIEILTKSIEQTCIDKRKTLLIASFSIQRSSELLWLLRDIFLQQNGKFDKIPIYLDSPMACDSQKVMNENREFWNERDLKIDEELGSLFEWKQVIYTKDSKSSKALANGDVKIIISSGGMIQGGRIVKHIENFLPSKGCKLLLTGFQGMGTMGRRLLETREKSIKVEGKDCKLKAKIELMEFSSHADYNQIVELLKTTKKGKLKKIFINHGQTVSSEHLKKEIEKNLKVETIIPKYLEEYTIKI
jgi:metallo-beta-lactamase family protein